jgi:glutathione peroxidase
MFGKIDVNGPRRHPVYGFLTAAATTPDGPGDVQWNFAKFLVDRAGNVVARFSPSTAPVSEEIVGSIEKLLA